MLAIRVLILNCIPHHPGTFAPVPGVEPRKMAPRPGVLRRRPRSSQDLVVGVPPGVALGGIAAAGIAAAALYAFTKGKRDR